MNTTLPGVDVLNQISLPLHLHFLNIFKHMAQISQPPFVTTECYLNQLMKEK